MIPSSMLYWHLLAFAELNLVASALLLIERRRKGGWRSPSQRNTQRMTVASHEMTAI